MPHTLIAGMTTSGKSALGKMLAPRWRARGYGIAVLDPMKAPEWRADFISTDPDAFLLYCKSHTGLAIFVDEGAAALSKAADYNWLTSRARHWGHETTIISQRPQDITTTVRGNCESLFLFNIDPRATELLAYEWNVPDLKNASTYPRLQFHFARRLADEGSRIGRLDFSKRSIVWLGATCNPSSPSSSLMPEPSRPSSSRRLLPRCLSGAKSRRQA